jgi:hypothetical protein
MLNRVHLLTGVLSVSGPARTFCGMVGWEDCCNEYDTAAGHRFEALPQRAAVGEKVTCKRCIEIAEGQ